MSEKVIPAEAARAAAQKKQSAAQPASASVQPEGDWQRRALKPARRQTQPRARAPVALESAAPKPAAKPAPAKAPAKPAAQARPAKTAARPTAAPTKTTATAKKPAAAATAKKPAAKPAGTTARKTPAAAQKPAARTTAARRTTATPAKPTAKKPAGAARKAARPETLPALFAGLKSAAKARKARGPKKKLPRNWSIVLALVICAGIGVLAAQVLKHYPDYQRFQLMRDTVERSTFYDGTHVDGIDVSGMTLRQAQEYWGDQIEPGYAARTVTIANVQGRSITAGELGYKSDYLEVLANAWDSARSGSLEERYYEVTQRTGTPASYAITRSFYDEEMIERYVKAAAKNLNIAPTEPKVKSFDMDTLTFSFTEGTMGQRLDEEKMAADIRETLDGGSGSITLALNAVAPEKTVDDIRDDYGLIASARTNASTSSPARLSNLRMALASIDGVSIKPGATFSFNETVGQRTLARGYQPAGAYAAGEVIEEVGGGICQVSTTLFNAAVKSDLAITERHNHSMPVGYVDKGKDATVDWGRLDFKFTNDTDTEIFISAYLNSDKRVVVGLYGKKLEDGKYITVEGITTGTEDFETVYEVNATLAPGTQNVKQEGRTGYLAEAYKIVWDKDGRQLSRTLLCRSHYLARNKIIEVNG